MPFTLRNIKEDLDDIGSRFDGAPDLEFRAATKPLELEESGLSYQRVPPGYRFPYGHTHAKQEEVYVVVRGSGRMKVDDEIVELKEWDAVRVPPGMKLLLTSAGIKNTSIHDALVDLLGKPIEESDALCIPTASYAHPMAGPGRAWSFISGQEPRCPMRAGRPRPVRRRSRRRRQTLPRSSTR